MLGTLYYLLEIMKWPKEGLTSFLHGVYSLINKTDIQMIALVNAQLQTVESAMREKTTVPWEHAIGGPSLVSGK